MSMVVGLFASKLPHVQDRSRGDVHLSPLWSCWFMQWARLDSNQGPTDYESWPPPGVPPGLADPRLLDRVEQPRAAPRTAGAVEQPGSRGELIDAGIGASMPPAMSRRHRDTKAASGLPQRHPVQHRLRQRQRPSRSELCSTVNLHPGPPIELSSRRPTAWDEARMPPQPFTTSVGTSASR